ncbi:DUF3710 domain-containing protein [Streptomyces collinus]
MQAKAIIDKHTIPPTPDFWKKRNKSAASKAVTPRGNNPRSQGPWDYSEVDQPVEGRLDFGGLILPIVDNMEIRVDVAGNAIISATVVLRDSAIHLQAFAAPKSEGIWDAVREEIGTGIVQQGGIIDEVEGPLGWELQAQVQVQLPDGSDGFQIVRFVGVDGPRWFLRGVISGKAALHPHAASEVEQVFRDTVVVRGQDPMAPRDPILLRLSEGMEINSPSQEPENGAAAS